jgi:hypothetical protein
MILPSAAVVTLALSRSLLTVMLQRTSPKAGFGSNVTTLTILTALIRPVIAGATWLTTP